MKRRHTINNFRNQKHFLGNSKAKRKEGVRKIFLQIKSWVSVERNVLVKPNFLTRSQTLESETENFDVFKRRNGFFCNFKKFLQRNKFGLGKKIR